MTSANAKMANPRLGHRPGPQPGNANLPSNNGTVHVTLNTLIDGQCLSSSSQYTSQ